MIDLTRDVVLTLLDTVAEPAPERCHPSERGQTLRYAIRWEEVETGAVRLPDVFRYHSGHGPRPLPPRLAPRSEWEPACMVAVSLWHAYVEPEVWDKLEINTHTPIDRALHVLREAGHIGRYSVAAERALVMAQDRQDRGFQWGVCALHARAASEGWSDKLC